MNQPTPAGWYPDPERPGQQRYFNGSEWTEHRQAAAPPAGPPAMPPSTARGPASPQFSGSPKKQWWKRPWVIILGAIIVIVAIASGSSDNSSKSGSSTNDPSAGSASKSGGSSSNKATDDNTPHVGPSGSVRVDALVWRLQSARTTKTIGDQQYGLGAKANGVFVVVKLKVHSTKTDSVTLSDDVVHLEVNGKTYDADSDGSVAAIGAGKQPFFLDTLGPDSNRTGTVVFDVPPKVLTKTPEVRFNELGFGETHGYIRLPPLT